MLLLLLLLWVIVIIFQLLFAWNLNQDHFKWKLFIGFWSNGYLFKFSAKNFSLFSLHARNQTLAKLWLNMENSLNFLTGPIRQHSCFLSQKSITPRCCFLTSSRLDEAQKCTSAVSTHSNTFNRRSYNVLFTPQSFSTRSFQTQSIQNIWEWPCRVACVSAWDNLYIKCGVWKIAISIFRWPGLSITKMGWVTTPCES